MPAVATSYASAAHSARTRRFALTNKFIPLFLALLLLASAVALRIKSLKTFGGLYDEQITRAVVTNIWKGDLTNNWKFAEVPVAFKRNCYNFSSYFYVDALLTGRNAYHGLFKDRILSAVLGSLAVLVFSFVAFLVFGKKIALAALAIMAVCPLLVQDAHYARPEAFVTLVFALVYVLIILSLRSTYPLRYLLASSFLCGFLIACKISFIPAALIPLLCLANQKLRTVPIAVLWIVATVLGAFVGVPHAFLHPAAFMQGVAMLRTQYANIHPPFSLPDSRFAAGLLVPYFWQTLGPLCCLLWASGMVAILHRRQYLNLLLFAAPIAFYITYFSLQRTFFERNLSHVVPLIAILGGVGLTFLWSLIQPQWRTPISVAVLLTSLVRPTYVSTKLVFDAMRTTPERRASALTERLEKKYSGVAHLGIELIAPENLDDISRVVNRSATDVILPTHDYHDPFTRQASELAKERLGAREIGYYPSIFPNLATNTILTYHAWGLRYLLLASPNAYQINGMTFTASRNVLGPIANAPVLRNSSWTENGIPPVAKTPPFVRSIFGSYTRERGDSNQGRIELGPIRIPAEADIGVPLLTGPSQNGLSLIVRDHATHQILAESRPLPHLQLWNIWRLPAPSGKTDQIDLIAVDEGSGWGEWFGIGLPVALRK